MNEDFNRVLQKSTVMVIIDPQGDFMDQPGAALAVPGATADMERLARFIDEQGKRLDAIVVTLDTHVEDHIAHPIRWIDVVDPHGSDHPAPFTTIRVEDVEKGLYVATNTADQAWQLAYVQKLKACGGKDLMIWPPHCIVGTSGHGIQSTLMKSISEWMKRTGRTVKIIEKGRNRDTEQYGAFEADVKIESASETHRNQYQIDHLMKYKRHIWAGEALSHCLMASYEQVCKEEAYYLYERIILTDATSPVAGFESVATEWLASKKAEGVRLATTTELVL